MPTVFCAHCRIEKEPRIDQRREVFTIKGKRVEIQANVAVCTECGEDIFLTGLEEQNFKRAYDAYRRENDLLTAAEIVAIREQYGLSQRALAQLVGWGEVTVSRYENGAIQTRGHDHFLRLLKDPENIRRLLDEGEPGLSLQVSEQLGARLDELLRSRTQHSLQECLMAFLGSGEPSMINGFRKFDLERAHQATGYLAARVKHFFKSKATKLLWYSDFLAFKSQARSITGCEYQAAKFGPVPRDYEWLFAEMVSSSILIEEEVLFGSEDNSGVGGKLYRPGMDCNLDALSNLERKCLEVVALEFENLTANQTINRAHEEAAYLQVFEECKTWKAMPYDLAISLSLPAISE
ncbi:DUF4065 domain-containing protein [Candidatus Bipolaricaulota bacterium]|nr:DUF4065 domain-containing protein [Candidatus Bipolaricaulota bacterium]